MKADTEFLEFMWPMRHFLVTCGDRVASPNIITVSFCMPVSKDPPMLAIAIGKSSWSNHLIQQTGEFAVNVPSQELHREIYFCGYHSGRTVDKFRETGLTAVAAKSIRPPVIAECLAHMECVVKHRLETGDKMIIVGQVVEAYADRSKLAGEDRIPFAAGEFPRKVYGTRFAWRISCGG